MPRVVLSLLSHACFYSIETNLGSWEHSSNCGWRTYIKRAALLKLRDGERAVEGWLALKYFASLQFSYLGIKDPDWPPAMTNSFCGHPLSAAFLKHRPSFETNSTILNTIFLSGNNIKSSYIAHKSPHKIQLCSPPLWVRICVLGQ